MPSFTFKGFTTGSPVAISASQGGYNASRSVATWGENTVTGSLEILQIEAQAVPAPTAVWFEAINLSGFDVAGGPGPGQVYDPSFDGITYVWTVEGQSAQSFEVPNLVTGWDNARIAYGKKVAFFFDQPNTTYTIRCWAIDRSGNRGEATTVFVTQSADSLYPGAATICLDPSGSFAGAPAGAQLVTSVSAMQSAIWGATSSRRVLIARGQDIPNFVLNETNGRHVRHVGAFGSGNRPILRSNGVHTMLDFYRTAATHLTIECLDCRGLWDATTETGRPSDLFRPFQSSLQNVSIWDCNIDGFAMLNTTLNDTATFVAAVGKTRITNWNGYGVFIADTIGKFAFVGCDVAQHVQALNHSQTERNGMVNEQGPLRIESYDAIYIGASSFMSRAGWSGGNDQPCLRLNSNSREGAQTILDRVTCEAGGAVISLSASNGNILEKQGNHLLDKVLIVAGGGKTGYEMMFAHYGGTTLRNVVFVMPNTPNYHGIGFHNCLQLLPFQNDSANLAAPLKFYNCTSLNLRSSANDFGDNPQLTGTSDFSDYTFENNIVHGSTLDTPVTANAVTTNGASVFIPRYLGVRPNFPFETGTLGGSIGSGGSFTLPYPGGTNQAYWTAIQAIDNRHMMKMGNSVYYAAYDGGFAVTYETGQVRITNTSGSTWMGGSAWTLRLDRKSHLPAMDTTWGNPPTLPLAVPVAGSAITQGNDTSGSGLWAYDDFLGKVRPAPEGGVDHTGAARPTTGRAQGAVQTP